ncbi:ArsR/SmtB family transcription factor [Sunxiuqinia sp. sy24]|uniref:ArsR/SmtB family transcription factor n=1 Tax=Sunxiuqinia sp. sy24 TaxID=3461495 RepID=UPI004045AC6D
MTKVTLFDQELQETAAIYKALGHPARLAILNYLAETKQCISGDISDELPLSRTTVHQHLKELKKLGLIQGEIQGVKTSYCLNTEKIKRVRGTLNGFLDELGSCPAPNCQPKEPEPTEGQKQKTHNK